MATMWQTEQPNRHPLGRSDFDSFRAKRVEARTYAICLARMAALRPELRKCSMLLIAEGVKRSMHLIATHGDEQLVVARDEYFHCSDALSGRRSIQSGVADSARAAQMLEAAHGHIEIRTQVLWQSAQAIQGSA